MSVTIAADGWMESTYYLLPSQTKLAVSADLGRQEAGLEGNEIVSLGMAKESRANCSPATIAEDRDGYLS